MITRVAVEYAVMAYVMTKHGIGVPIFGSMQRYWSVWGARCLRYIVRYRSERDAANADTAKLER